MDAVGKQGGAAEGQGDGFRGRVGGKEDPRILRGGRFDRAEADHVRLAGEDVDLDRLVAGGGLGIRRRQLDGDDIGDGRQRGEKDGREAREVDGFHGTGGEGFISA